MKLYDWLEKQGFPDPLDIEALILAGRDGKKLGAMEGYKSDGFHVIGTCGGCKYFSVETGYCSHAKMSHFMTHKNFGCIHFETKGEK